MTTTQGLANIQRLANSNPGARLTPEQRAAYEKILDSVARAKGAVRRAKSKGDEVALAKAQRSLDRAAAKRAVFCAPFVAGLYAPERIVALFESPWSGKGTRGVHVQEVEFRLDHVDLSGPEYVAVRCLRDEGGPSENARKPPHIYGIAWFAVADTIARGKLRVLADEVA